MTKPVAYICCPLGASTQEEILCNIANAERYSVWAELGGNKTIVPHRLATILNDSNPEHRRMGIEIDLKILFPLADKVFVFGDRISSGMEKEIALAKEKNIEVKYFSLIENNIVERS